MDMKLIDIKDTLPVGFMPIQETIDTRKCLFLSPSVPVLVWSGHGGLFSALLLSGVECAHLGAALGCNKTALVFLSSSGCVVGLCPVWVCTHCTSPAVSEQGLLSCQEVLRFAFTELLSFLTFLFPTGGQVCLCLLTQATSAVSRGNTSLFLHGRIASLQLTSEQFPSSVFSSPGACASSSWSLVWWQPCVEQQAARALGWQGTSPVGVECERMAGLGLVPGARHRGAGPSACQ